MIDKLESLLLEDGRELAIVSTYNANGKIYVLLDEILPDGNISLELEPYIAEQTSEGITINAIVDTDEYQGVTSYFEEKLSSIKNSRAA